jgi:hypothetical protein
MHESDAFDIPVKSPVAKQTFDERLMSVLLRTPGIWIATTDLRHALAAKDGKEPSVGLLHIAVQRLSQKGRIQLRTVPGGPERGGRDKLLVQISRYSRVRQDSMAVMQQYHRDLGYKEGERPLLLIKHIRDSARDNCVLEVVRAEDNENGSEQFPLRLFVVDVDKPDEPITLWIPHAMHVTSLASMAARRSDIVNTVDLFGTRAYVTYNGAAALPSQLLTVEWTLPAQPKPKGFWHKTWDSFLSWLRME